MMKKTLLTVIAIAAIALCACQTQGNKIGANATDIGGKTWTDGFEFSDSTAREAPCMRAACCSCLCLQKRDLSLPKVSEA